MHQLNDKHLHSAVGLGFYLAALFTLDFRCLIGLAIVAILKEIFDYFLYKKFDFKDFKASLNPFIVLNYYAKTVNLKERILNHSIVQFLNKRK